MLRLRSGQSEEHAPVLAQDPLDLVVADHRLREPGFRAQAFCECPLGAGQRKNGPRQVVTDHAQDAFHGHPPAVAFHLQLCVSKADGLFSSILLRYCFPLLPPLRWCLLLHRASHLVGFACPANPSYVGGGLGGLGWGAGWMALPLFSRQGGGVGGLPFSRWQEKNSRA